MTSQFSYWQQQQQAQQQALLAQQAAQQGGPVLDPYMQQLAQQGQNGQFPPPTSSNGPYQPQPPSQGQQLAGQAGQIGGYALGQAGANALTGSGAASAVAPAASAAAPLGGYAGGMSSTAVPAGYEATSSALGLGGDAATSSAVNASAVPGVQTTGMIGATLPWLGIAGLAAYTGMTGLDAYNKAEHKGWLGGTKQGIKSAGALNAVPLLGQVPWVAGAIRGGFGGAKHRDQYRREAIEGTMKQGGFLDNENQYTLADGSKFSFGIDGTHTLKNQGSNIDGKDTRHYYDVDFSDPRAGSAVAALQGLGAIFAGDDKKSQEQITGKLVNAALSSGDTVENIAKMISDAGFEGHDQIYGAIHLMAEDKRISKEFADSVKNGLDEFYGVGAYAHGAAPSKVPDAFAPNNGLPQKPPVNLGPKDTNVKPNGMDPRDPRQAIRNAPAQQSQAQKPTAKDTNVIRPRTSPFLSSALNTRGPTVSPRTASVMQGAQKGPWIGGRR